MAGPRNEDSDRVHAEKYRGTGENFREAMNRVAAALQDSNDHYRKFREILMDMRFLPAGRIQAAMGSLKNVTAFNCFVMGTIHDSFVDGPSEEELKALPVGMFPPTSIMQTAVEAAQTMRQGGGVGYDISPLRPKGDVIRGVQSTTDGPMAFAPIYDAVCRATASAGNRRGAQMLTMRIDHPDIEAFIHAKQSSQDVPYEFRPLRGFNMSILVTDEFMDCLASGKPFPLRFGGQIYRHIDPHALWEMIMRGTYDWAEPGVLFIDTINRMNNLHYCEKIASTNPCGEQPLPPYGACLLGSLNLVKYLVLTNGKYSIDYFQIEEDLPHILRAMDNVIDRTQYPLNQQKLEAHRKRRIGIGVTGLANAIEAMGHPYGSPGFVKIQSQIQSFITTQLYYNSVRLAHEKGSFEFFEAEPYLDSGFMLGMDSDLRAEIAKTGIRNSHLTSIAPTGTISFSADNVSSGIEPVIAYAQQRRVIMKEGPITVEVPDYGVEYLGVRGRTIKEVTPGEHIAVLTTAQRFVDSACSKTCNLPFDISFNDFKDVYLKAYELGAKGCTTYRPNANYEDVIKEAQEKSEPEPEACGFDPETGMRTGACSD